MTVGDDADGLYVLDQGSDGSQRDLFVADGSLGG